MITTFAELADLMEPEWFARSVVFDLDRVEMRLERRTDWDDIRATEGTFAKFHGESHGDGTQTIHITLEKKS